MQMVVVHIVYYINIYFLKIQGHCVLFIAFPSDQFFCQSNDFHLGHQQALVKLHMKLERVKNMTITMEKFHVCAMR